MRFEGDAGARYSAPYMDHADRIASEMPEPKRYGVFALVDGSASHAIFHANVAGLPGTRGDTLRILWVLLAPIYDYEDRSQDEIARLTSSVLNQSLTMCQNGVMRANHLKIHLQNVGDRRFAIALAVTLKGVQTRPVVAVRGTGCTLKTLFSHLGRLATWLEERSHELRNPV